MNAIEVSDVEIFLQEVPGRPDFRAYANFVVNGAVLVRDAVVIRGGAGRLRAAMPSRPHRISCPRCGRPTEAAGRYCCRCGACLGPSGQELYHRMVKPLGRRAAVAIEEAILAAYREAAYAAAIGAEPALASA